MTTTNKKISILTFKIDWCFSSEMNRKLRPTKSTHQIKEEQIIFLLEDDEKKLEEQRKAIELKDKWPTESKKYFREQKIAMIH